MKIWTPQAINSYVQILLFLHCIAFRHASKSFYMHFRSQCNASKNDVNQALEIIQYVSCFFDRAMSVVGVTVTSQLSVVSMCML